MIGSSKIGLRPIRGGGGGAGAFPYIADKYAGIQAAHSLFKASESYSGDCLQVQSSNDGTYTEIPFDGDKLDLVALQAAADGVTLLKVTKWYDSSGNGNDLFQDTASIQPVIGRSGVLDLNGNAFIMAEGNEITYMNTQGLIAQSVLDIYGSFKVTNRYFSNWATPLIGHDNTVVTLIADPLSTSTAINANFGSPTYYVDNVDITSSTRADIWNALIGEFRIVSAIGGTTSSGAWTSAALWNNYKNKHTMGEMRGMYFFTSDTSADREDIEADIQTLAGTEL